MRTTVRWLLAAFVLAGVSQAAWAGEHAGSTDPGRRPQGARYVYLDVQGALSETLPPVYLLEPDETLHDLVRRIERAGRDPAVRGLIVSVHPFEAGWAKAQEIRDALARCTSGGKDVVCMLEEADNCTYYLATGAGRIVMAPAGQVMLCGPRAEALFAGELMDTIGVKADLVQAGKYKGAAEPLTRMNASPAFRESLEGLLQGYYDLMLDGIAGGRHMPVSRAEELLGRGPCAALEAKQAGLVDDVLFYDELLGQLQERDGEKPLVQKDYGATARERPLSFLSLLMGGPIVPRPTPGGPAIAVLYAVGPIFSGEEDLSLGEQAVASEDFIQVIREAAADANVKAIVLRVDSPGGSALACDQIWRELRLADRKKPVVASFSDTAASGGYYIGAAARKIYAEPGTLTGSIGVVGGKLVLAGLLGKIGVNVEVFERGHGGGFLSSFEEFSPAERRRLQELVQDTYRTFLSRVAETRPALSGARLEQVAGGRVWTGKQAHDNGLVDEVGGLSEAIQAAKEAAGIPPEQTVRIMHLPRARSLVEVLLFGSDKQAQAPSPWDAMSMALPVPELRAYLRALTLLRGETSLCILPAALIIR